jgi:hypothetical protein
MKIVIKILIPLLILGCFNDKDSIKEDLTTKKEITIAELIQKFPTISDSSEFIRTLVADCKLEIDCVQNLKEDITRFEKINIYGCNKDIIFVEYDFHDGCGAAFPYKHQILFDSNGNIIAKLNEMKVQLTKVFENEYPLLFTVNSTSKGNGWHQLLKFNNDTLKNIFEGTNSYHTRTYDKHHDAMINEPYELNSEFKDVNNDGYKDLIFKGKIILIRGLTPDGIWYDHTTINGKEVSYSKENSFKEIPVEYIFYYNLKTGHFEESEDYAKKYFSGLNLL